ncbi:hypothetical protein B0T21DRAFT_340624 [Apiosordaria backusii]|uniref:Mid2 domain-containing protein n=1 Tax=Apiosordaria backusii TaxID=314023 RepID=A0AA40A737_9PEZI|nr:hypothetical protein B0T21DRAFT_340624 [Apiosordaria backusii]
MRITTAATALLPAVPGLLVSAQSNNQELNPSLMPSFVFPVEKDEPETYHFMDTVMVEYISFFANVTLWTFCKPGVGEMEFVQKAPGFNATVPITLNFTSATPCWFNVRTGADHRHDAYAANSQTFNVIGQERREGRKTFGAGNAPSRQSSSLSSSVAPSPSTTVSVTGSSSTQSSASRTGDAGSSNDNNAGGGALTTGTNRPSSSEAPSSGLSAGTAAGIGVGVAVGVLALGLGIFFWFWKSRKRNQEAYAAEGQHLPPGPYGHGDVYAKVVEAPPKYASPGPEAAHHHSYRHRQYQFGGELSTANTPQEMGDTRPGIGYGRSTHEMAG